jgi:anaerobic ribonucleoside-triphosphate reductase
MNSLTQINDILNDHFASEFNENYISQYENKDDCIDEFEYDFESYYNSETDYIDFSEIKQLCNFNNVMKICEYVFEKYVEFGMPTNDIEFGDKILKSYIYFYINEEHKYKFIEEIENYAFDDEPATEQPSQ